MNFPVGKVHMERRTWGRLLSAVFNRIRSTRGCLTVSVRSVVLGSEEANDLHPMPLALNRAAMNIARQNSRNLADPASHSWVRLGLSKRLFENYNFGGSYLLWGSRR